jgi:hypothetical protein
MLGMPQQGRYLIVLAAILAIAMAGWLADQDGRLSLAFVLVSAAVLYLWGWAFGWLWCATRGGRPRPRYLVRLIAVAILLAAGGLYLSISLWVLRPDLLPQRAYYNSIANRHVTERLVDPELLKVERWEILGQERHVLFVHPTPSGSVALIVETGSGAAGNGRYDWAGWGEPRLQEP